MGTLTHLIGPSVGASLRVANFEGSFAPCGPINDNYWPRENDGPTKLADDDTQLADDDAQLADDDANFTKSIAIDIR